MSDLRKRILVVGAGAMGEALVRGALARGMHPVVTSRTAAHAQALADRYGRPAWPLDPGARLAGLDAVTLARGGPWQLSVASEASLAGVPLVIDLSMPPSVPAGARAELGERLVDIDGLADRADDDRPRSRYLTRLARLASCSPRQAMSSKPQDAA